MTQQSIVMLAERSVRSKYFESVLPILRSAGLRVVMATVRERGDLHEALEAHGFATHALGATTSRGYASAARRLSLYLAANSPEAIVHAHEPIAAVVAGAACVGRRRRRVLMHRHHVGADGAQAALSWLATRTAARIVCVSQASAAAAVERDRASPAQVVVAHNGVDAPRLVGRDELDRLRHSLAVPPELPVVTVVARLRPVKGVDVLLRALAEMPADQAAPHLVVVGTGSDDGDLQRLAGELGLAARTHFVGHQTDVAPWLRLADVVAMPSRDEAFPLAALEALACGRPFVASAVGGLVEMVDDGRSALLVPPNNPAALAAALSRVLRSPQLASALAEEGRRTYERSFTTHAMADAWVSVYRTVGGLG